MKRNEIIIYESNDLSTVLEVSLEDETVWLTQAQMVKLFQATKQNISLHIKRIYKEKELHKNSTVKYYLTVQNEGNRQVKRKIATYNLDVIISVGYRVKSLRGTQFRIWANSIIKDYLLKGHVINNRVDKIEKKLLEHEQKFELIIKANLPPYQGVFYDGQLFDAYKLASDLIRLAKSSIVLIDNYVNEKVLLLLSKRSSGVNAIIFTAKISKQLELDINQFNSQYPEIIVKEFKKSHDRFLIIDKKDVYHIGASLKDLGNKWFAFSKIGIDAQEIINKLESK